MNVQITQKCFLGAVTVFSLSLLIFSLNLHANDGEKPEAKTELQMKLKLLSSFQTEFSQSITDLLGNELQSSSGKLSLQKPNQLRWETILPDEALLIADGTTIWNIDPFVEQVTVMAQDKMIENNPLMLLVSDSEQQWQGVSVSKVKAEADNPENLRSVFNVVSLDPNANIVSLVISFKNNQLVSLKSKDRQQQQSLMIFSNSIENEILTKDHFAFKIPSNYIIDDQRSQ
jgi:outer membrane lipoprotein carrier protein